MIELIEGRGVGAGKSYMIMTRLLPHWIRGGTACVSDTVEIKWAECKKYASDFGRVVLEDDQYRSISSDDLQRLHEVTPPGTADLPVLLVVDEAQDAFNARDWNDKSKRPFFSWLCQSRHDDNDVIIISQAVANVDKQVRRLATYIWSTRNTEHFPLFGTTLAALIKLVTLGLHDGKLFRITQIDQDGRTALDKRWHKANKRIFGCYVSKSMRGKHARLGEAVAVKKLQRVETTKGKKQMKFAAIIFFALLAFGGWKIYHRGNPMVSKDKPATSSPAPARSEKAAEKTTGPAYLIERATYLGAFPGMLCTVEFGNVVQGELSSLGFVETAQGNRARIRTPEGKLLYLIADKPLKERLAETLAVAN